jgi:hypothetical protein
MPPVVSEFHSYEMTRQSNLKRLSLADLRTGFPGSRIVVALPGQRANRNKAANADSTIVKFSKGISKFHENLLLYSDGLPTSAVELFG